MKILLIDDHVLFRAGLRMLLSTMQGDLEILEGGTCDEALSIAHQNPDLRLCLLDLKLRDEDGMSAVSIIKETYPGISVVVVSADESASTIYRALEEGAMGYIPKSVSADVMTQALNLVLAGGIYLPSSLLESRKSEFKRPAPRTDDDDELELTSRQHQVLQGLLRGWPNKLISRHMCLSENTIKSHLSGIYRVLNVTSRAQAVVAASQLGIHADFEDPVSHDEQHE